MSAIWLTLPILTMSRSGWRPRSVRMSLRCMLLMWPWWRYWWRVVFASIVEVNMKMTKSKKENLIARDQFRYWWQTRLEGYVANLPMSDTWYPRSSVLRGVDLFGPSSRMWVTSRNSLTTYLLTQHSIKFLNHFSGNHLYFLRRLFRRTIDVCLYQLPWIHPISA